MSSEAQVEQKKIDYTARFLAMTSAALRLGESDEVTAKKKLEPAQEAAPPPPPHGEEAPEPWLITAEELEAIDREEQERQARKNARVKVKLEQPHALTELLELKKYRPKRGRGAGTEGAGALARLAYDLACRVLQFRPYLYDKDGKLPSQIVLHLSGEMVAEVLGVSENTVREWTSQLAADGFLEARPHYTTAKNWAGEDVTMMDGTLYAVRLKPGRNARLRYSDMKRQYRDLDADRKAGRTAYNAIQSAHQKAQRWAEWRAAEDAKGKHDPDAGKNTSGSSHSPEERVREELRQQLRRWAVIPGDLDINPVNSDSELFGDEGPTQGPRTVLDVVHSLPLLGLAHYSERAALVGIMGATLARALKDQHSRNFYCRLIWEAWNQELIGIPGLQALATQIMRLEIDRREWKDLRNPGALLASRMRAA